MCVGGGGGGGVAGTRIVCHLNYNAVQCIDTAHQCTLVLIDTCSNKVFMTGKLFIASC